MVKFQVSAPGKVILYGEHAVVYGKTAIAASLNLRTNLEFRELPLQQQVVTIALHNLNLYEKIPLANLKDFLSMHSNLNAGDHDAMYNSVKQFVHSLGHTNLHQKLSLESIVYSLAHTCQMEQLELKPFEMHITSDLSIGAGLGSSAAFAVCLSACFLHWSRLQKCKAVNVCDHTDLQKISNYAFNCERIIHGTPSGIDNSVCTFGAIVEFSKSEGLQPIFSAYSMKILLVDTRVQRNTKQLVEKLYALKQKYPNVINQILDAIDSIAKYAVVILKKIRDMPEDSPEFKQDYEELMKLINLNHGLLSTCEVSHHSLDGICCHAKNYGYAAKLTGAGGGGYAYILLRPDTQSEDISRMSHKLVADGYNISLTALGCPGVQISPLES
ncbi:mevalonate kinase [Prorops nasuta]|uniref:mevalonate kinase n=1 Tax=Prorops nasuta TaxID=863751 RepID=UPI0034CFBAC2